MITIKDYLLENDVLAFCTAYNTGELATIENGDGRKKSFSIITNICGKYDREEISKFTQYSKIAYYTDISFEYFISNTKPVILRIRESDIYGYEFEILKDEKDFIYFGDIEDDKNFIFLFNELEQVGQHNFQNNDNFFKVYKYYVLKKFKDDEYVDNIKLLIELGEI